MNLILFWIIVALIVFIISAIGGFLGGLGFGCIMSKYIEKRIKELEKG